jgi:HSP20 family protein
MASTLVNKEETLRPLFDDLFTSDPFGTLTSMRKAFNSFFDTSIRPRPFDGYMLPSMDLYNKEGSYVVEMALPGLDKKDVNIDVEGNCLTISGKYSKDLEETEKAKRYHYRELRRGSFSRSVTFPENIDPAKVVASFEAGLLKVEIPALRPAENKKIPIK